MPVQRFEGQVEILNSHPPQLRQSPITIILDGETGKILLNGDIAGPSFLLKNGLDPANPFLFNEGGQIELLNTAGRVTVWLNGTGGNCQIGGNGFDGAITLKDAGDKETVRLHAGGGNIQIHGATFFPPDDFAWFHIDNGPSSGRPIGRLRISYGDNPGDNEVISVLQNGLVGINTPDPDPTASLTVKGVSPDDGGTLDAAGVVGRVTNLGGNGRQTAGVRGVNDEGHGVQGRSDSHIGVEGTSNKGTAVFAESQDWIGVMGITHNGPLAGLFQGNVGVTGSLTKAGGGFKIDHPLDPANKYLNHSFVESPDMKNVYDGVVILDAQGEAVVELPKWFDALNKDFRYQLTAIGAPGPNLYIAEEISRDHFKIAGGTPKMKVSWQVTGIRKDAWAQEHLLVVEEEKLDKERDHYLHPKLYNQPEEKDVMWARYLR
jgi:hypothetical protein